MIPVGRLAVLLSLCFSVNVATPFANVISPMVPLIDVSPRVTVKLKSFVCSPALPLTVLETVRLPVSVISVQLATKIRLPTVPGSTLSVEKVVLLFFSVVSVPRLQ